MNLLRHPAWGRAQETYGEDPHLLGEMGAALTRGVQEHVLACVKHFACNSMENARFTVDVTADERALHEVYLPHFKRVVDEGVASVMSSYNSLNGEWAGQSRALLTGVLRDEWGFDGLRHHRLHLRAARPGRLGAGRARRRDAVRAAAGGRPARRARRRRAHARPRSTVPATRVVATLLRFADRVTASPPPVIGAGRTRAPRAGAPGRGGVDRPADEPRRVPPRRRGPDGSRSSAGSRRCRTSATAARRRCTRRRWSRRSTASAPRTPTPTSCTPTPTPSIAAGADLVVVVVGYTKADEGEYIESTNADLFTLFPPVDDPRVGSRRAGAAAPARAAGARARRRRGDDGHGRRPALTPAVATPTRG